jgi:putative transposase
MIRAYSLRHSINSKKQDTILSVLSEYRAIAQKVSNIQWREFFKTSKFNKNVDIKSLKTKLSARYKQTLQYQVVGQLDSYISNRQNDFVDIVLKSSLNQQQRKDLLYINKAKAWFLSEFKEFDIDTLRLAKTIIKRAIRKNRKPNLKYCNMALDSKVAKIEKSKGGKFDYWITLSTLEKGKTIKLPVVSNKYFESKNGDIKKFVQLNFNKNNDLKITLLKDINKDNYISKTKKIALDLGLNNLFATNNGDLFGRGFSKIIKKYDKYITLLAKNRQKQKLKTASNRYKKLVLKLKQYLKNEVNRVINKIIKNYRPAEIVVERLNFQSPKLSRRLNRVLSNFGKSIITGKFQSLKEEFGIKITEINPAYTSQECSKCGYIAKSNRKNQETFICGFCNSKQNADINASKVIFSRSSTKLKDIFLNKAFILDKLVTQFFEQHSSHNSLANILVGNPYFRKMKQIN